MTKGPSEQSGVNWRVTRLPCWFSLVKACGRTPSPPFTELLPGFQACAKQWAEPHSNVKLPGRFQWQIKETEAWQFSGMHSELLSQPVRGWVLWLQKSPLTAVLSSQRPGDCGQAQGPPEDQGCDLGLPGYQGSVGGPFVYCLWQGWGQTEARRTLSQIYTT